MTVQLGSVVLLSALLVNIACNTTSEVKAPEGQRHESASQQPSSPLIPSGVFNQDPKAAEAWRLFTANGRYRIARRDDFEIPEEVMKEHQNDPFFTNNFAYVGGDFNRDGALLDRAFIVVDTTTTAKERFGLVVLNASTQENSLPSVYWVYKARDLSKSVLSAATDVLCLTEYFENGSEEVCNVRWDSKRDEYSCERVK
jgi:hypothetical protein